MDSKKISNKDFHEWLKNGGTAPLSCQRHGYHHAFVRFPKNEDFVYVFAQSAYHGNSVIRGDVFDFCGMYYIPEGLMYCEDRRISDLVEDWEYDNARSTGVLHDQYVSQFQESVENVIRPISDKLMSEELTDLYYRNQLSRIRERNAMELSAMVYFKGQTDEDIIYECEYEPEQWNEESLLEYVRDRAAYLQKEVVCYIGDRKQRIIYELKKNEVLRQTFKELMENTEHPYHRMKQLTDAINASKAKTVTVTINKCGEEFRFKTSAEHLKGLRTYYSAYYMAAPDRREFEKLFGNGADYTVEDIREVTYGRRILYEYEPPVQSESENNIEEPQGLTMDM